MFLVWLPVSPVTTPKAQSSLSKNKEPSPKHQLEKWRKRSVILCVKLKEALRRQVCWLGTGSQTSPLPALNWGFDTAIAVKADRLARAGELMQHHPLRRLTRGTGESYLR